MEGTKRKISETKILYSYSTSKRRKSTQKEEVIVIKIDPFKFESEMIADFPKIEIIEDLAKFDNGSPMLPSKCPKCSISYKSQASMKNHVQVCKVDEHGQVSNLVDLQKTQKII